MIIIYGVPKDVGRCYACNEAVRICEESGIDYKFIPVLYKTEDGFNYNRDIIISLAKKMNKTNLSIIYPQIFDDEKYIGGLLKFKEYRGYDE
ncbi:hypothetical protein [Providencia phage PSTRCR_127]|nr:hypothetical protein [Providencia phage PSTRCR_127]